MALSGRILGAFNGSIANTSYSRPVIEWSATQNISGNYSTVTASLVFERYHSTYNRSYNNSGHSVALTINGSRSTASRTFNIRDNTRSVVWTRTVRVNHNSDGRKSFSLAASGNTGVSLGSYSFSGTGALTQIARASTLSAFSLAGHLQPSTAVNLNYTIDRKSGSFRHHIQLRDGSHVVQTWDNVSSNGSTSVQLSTASVNNLLNRMSSTATRSLTLRVATRSGVGGGWIGSAVTRNATATVSATVKPTVSAVSVSQTGNTVSSHYLQGKSRVKASFTRSAGYGASISSSSITVRRKSTNNDVQTISGPSGTTGRAVNLSGTYEARGMARDSRGRTTYTAWKEFAVIAYSGPRITNFTVVRSSSAETTVSISRAGTHTPLGGSNVLSYTVQRRLGTGAWTNVNTNATGTSTTASFSGTSTSTGNAVTSSYDFRMVITDKFGERAESIVTVSTQRVVLDIHKNEGVGIGKVHEQGVLDVDGTVYMNGKIMALGGLGFEDTRSINEEPQEIPPRAFSFAFKQAGTVGNPPQRAHSTYAHILNIAGWNSSEGSGGYPMQMSIGSKGISLRQGTSTTAWGPWSSLTSGSSGSSGIDSSGTNNNGRWIKFTDGTQICWNSQNHGSVAINLSWGSLFARTVSVNNFPVSFTSVPTVSKSVSSSSSTLIMSSVNPQPTRTHPGGYEPSRGTATTASNLTTHYIAIGRWK